jgi:hypothetical protein
VVGWEARTRLDDSAEGWLSNIRCVLKSYWAIDETL